MNACAYQTTGITAAALQLVNDLEMEQLAACLNHDRVPSDLQAKLNRLHANDPRDHYLKQQSLLLLSLLRSAANREYRQLRPRECERLLRMLAYVRKDDDAIPDTLPGGLADDHDLMRLTCGEFREVLSAFKAWHLSRRVPLLWLGDQRPRSSTHQAVPLGG